MKKVTSPANLLLALLGFLFLVSFSVTVTLNFKPLYYMDMKLLDIPGQSGYSAEVIRENFDALIEYNNITYSGELRFTDMTMSESGRIHFEEVKAVFSVFEWLCIICGTLFFAGAVIQCRRHDFGFFKTTAIGSIAIPAVLGVFVLSDWETVFVEFHELVFDNDYWIFNPATDPVITILPDTYFMHCALMIVLIVVIGSVGCGLIYRRLIRKKDNK